MAYAGVQTTDAQLENEALQRRLSESEAGRVKACEREREAWAMIRGGIQEEEERKQEVHQLRTEREELLGDLQGLLGADGLKQHEEKKERGKLESGSAEVEKMMQWLEAEMVKWKTETMRLREGSATAEIAGVKGEGAGIAATAEAPAPAAAPPAAPAEVAMLRERVRAAHREAEGAVEARQLLEAEFEAKVERQVKLGTAAIGAQAKATLRLLKREREKVREQGEVLAAKAAEFGFQVPKLAAAAATPPASPAKQPVARTPQRATERGFGQAAAAASPARRAVCVSATTQTPPVQQQAAAAAPAPEAVQAPAKVGQAALAATKQGRLALAALAKLERQIGCSAAVAGDARSADEWLWLNKRLVGITARLNGYRTEVRAKVATEAEAVRAGERQRRVKVELLSMEVIGIRHLLSESSLEMVTREHEMDRPEYDAEDIYQVSNTKIKQCVAKIEALTRDGDESGDEGAGQAPLAAELFDVLLDNAQLRTQLNEFVWQMMEPAYVRQIMVEQQWAAYGAVSSGLTLPSVGGTSVEDAGTRRVGDDGYGEC